MKLNILIIDDEPDACEILSGLLTRSGHVVMTASDGSSGLHLFHENDFDLVITDIRMPGLDGLELLKQIKQVEQSPVDVIVVTGHGDMDNAIKALKYGAYDYLLKPIDVRELTISIDRLCKYLMLQANYQNLTARFDETLELEKSVIRGQAEKIQASFLEEIGLDGLRVYSKCMREVVDQAQIFAQDRQVPVLILGESGTGKELIARLIHHYYRPDTIDPFVAINCGAISPELFESELFGYESGSFTGSIPKGREGKLEAAKGGTIFFDEIGEMPFSLQVKLLRALDDKKIYRIGGLKEIPLDVRVISATNKDLRQEVRQKRFRLDLYYRINMGVIRIPPLRRRSEDILPLANYFGKRASLRRGERFTGFTREAEQFLLTHPWPGNVRQLKNTMGRLALMPPPDRIDVRDLHFIDDPDGMDNLPFDPTHTLGKEHFTLPEKKLDLQALESSIIKMALKKHQGNKSKTADYLGISRKILYSRLKRMESSPS